MAAKRDLDKALVFSATDLEELGFSRTMSYQMLNRQDLPVVRIGDRRFMNAALFREWLRQQAEAQSK